MFDRQYPSFHDPSKLKSPGIGGFGILRNCQLCCLVSPERARQAWPWPTFRIGGLPRLGTISSRLGSPYPNPDYHWREGHRNNDNLDHFHPHWFPFLTEIKTAVCFRPFRVCWPSVVIVLLALCGPTFLVISDTCHFISLLESALLYSQFHSFFIRNFNAVQNFKFSGSIYAASHKRFTEMPGTTPSTGKFRITSWHSVPTVFTMFSNYQ